MNYTHIKKSVSTIMLLMIQAYIFAQDTTRIATTSATSTVTSEVWYMQKWVWLIGAIVFILILVALFSGGSKNSSRTDKVIITKTVRTESDTD